MTLHDNTEAIAVANEKEDDERAATYADLGDDPDGDTEGYDGGFTEPEDEAELMDAMIAEDSDEEFAENEQWLDSDQDWSERSEQHSWIEFQGDKLGVRTPKQGSISAYAIATSEGSSAAKRNKYSRMIIENHMSPDSYERVMDRMGDPDDDFDDDALSDLVTQIIELRTGALPKPNRAQRRHSTT